MSELDDLRKEVSNRRAAATAKINRLRKQGVNVEGTTRDPRRELSAPKRYTKAQLNKYLQELNNFNRRDNGFVRLSDGIVTRQEWNTYKNFEQQYNRKGKRRYANVRNKVLPSGQTVEERDASMKPTNPKIRRAAGDASQRLYAPIRLTPEQIANPEALKKLIAYRKSQVDAKYEPAQIRKQRREMRAMVKRIGDPEITKATRSLTDDQFKLLWNYGSFSTDLSRDYERVQLLATGGSGAQQDSVHVDAREDVKDAVNWAKANVPAPQPKKRKR